MNDQGARAIFRQLWETYQAELMAATKKLQVERVNPILERRGWSLLCGNGTFLLRDETGKQITWMSVDETDTPDADVVFLLNLLETRIPGYGGGGFIDPSVGAEMEDYPPQRQGGPQ